MPTTIGYNSSQYRPNEGHLGEPGGGRPTGLHRSRRVGGFQAFFDNLKVSSELLLLPDGSGRYTVTIVAKPAKILEKPIRPEDWTPVQSAEWDGLIAERKIAPLADEKFELQLRGYFDRIDQFVPYNVTQVNDRHPGGPVILRHSAEGLTSPLIRFHRHAARW